MITLLLAALSLADPLPDIASKLPSTWPPPGWPTAPGVPGEKSPPSATTPRAESDAWVTLFPHVRINRALKAVEFDGVVAWDFHNPDTPRTELELLVCLPNRDKEHESLVLSRAQGAHVHAALLAAGLEPGAPGRIEFGAGDKVARVAPRGPEVQVTFTYSKDGKAVTDQAMTWVKDEGTPAAPSRFVFAGSRIGTKLNEAGGKVPSYDADELGCLIGLCTFGGETIALTTVVSPDSGLDAPRFVGRNANIPPAETPVRVRVATAPPGPAGVAPAQVR